MHIRALTVLLLLASLGIQCPFVVGDSDSSDSSGSVSDSSDSSSSDSDSSDKLSSSDSAKDATEIIEELSTHAAAEDLTDPETVKRIADLEHIVSEELSGAEEEPGLEAGVEVHLEVSLPLAEVFLKAAKLSILAYNPDLTDAAVASKAADELGLEYIKAFRAIPDQSFVALDNGTKECLGVFRGTNEGVEDWLQNFDLDEAMVEGCTARNGYLSAIHNSYFPEFDGALKDCLKKDCTDCTLTLTGHSQGGAAAVVASLLYADYNPEVITFGAPKAVYRPCDKIVDENHYRLANMIPTPLGVVYDMVAMVPGYGAEHFGHSILLGGGKMAAYLGKDEGHTRFHWGVSPHGMKYYIDNVEKLTSTIFFSGTIGLKGYEEGARCRYNDECESGRCDIGSWKYICKPKLGEGELCNEDSDCKSGGCSWTFTCTGV
ncbi:expressed unknown protein [Seminavis robusta]|uniref:Fungal lipase-type domain-containing protein n=1 Tax=Seminavis robusta TaxID=568900 RepID=A0A9N8DRT7_9STRA|nr:expressed unknown protein [Seminavis robusta]|eukprot:Sro324_g117530.1 n/a (432) ;mRNA; f:27677-29246